MLWTTGKPIPDGISEQFGNEGYVLLGRVLSNEGLAEARRHMDHMVDELHPRLQPDEFFSAHQQESWLLDLCCAPQLLDVIEDAIGTDIVLWSTHLICKRPQTGRAIPWHQDGTYWNVGGRFASIWLALDDLDDESGTMYVLPGYHRQIMPRRPTGNDFFAEEIDPSALPTDLRQREVGYVFAAGGAAMHDERIPHRSPPNRCANRWRRVLVLRYLSADSHMVIKQYPDYRTTEPFDRRFFLVRGDAGGHPLIENAAAVLETMRG